ncbi:Serine/threonine-protein kinase tousled-like protein [Oopsacas minuta]|uniref:Serine/threonine-protein kinase tousled-like protein n=1 Tax=Oopsacas minuta TaxID=111878 RepID=A0AAV7JC26_9METZ|nr:Serine/threonine-protein kinase tousled-like protein [Oopsacas minuta]
MNRPYSPGPESPSVHPVQPSIQLGLTNNNNNHSVLDNTDPQKLELLEAIMKGMPAHQDSNPTSTTQAYSNIQPVYPPILSQGSQNEHSSSQHSNSSGIRFSQGDDIVILSQSQNSINTSHDVTPAPSNTSFKSTRKRKYSDSDTPGSPSQSYTTPKSRASGSAPPISSYFQSLKIQKQQDPPSSPSIQSSPTFTLSVNEFVQTDLGLDGLKELEELRTKNSELSQSLAHSNHLLESREREFAVLQGRIDKCYVVMKELLLEKCRREKEQAMARSLANRIRLGTFSTERQGAHFVETWVEGSAFQELNKKSNNLVCQKEELEKQKKLLTKKKSASIVKTTKMSSDTEFQIPNRPLIDLDEVN